MTSQWRIVKGNNISHVFDGGRIVAENASHDDAYLIAAAPDLLKACEMAHDTLVNYFDEQKYHATIKCIEASYDKATTRTIYESLALRSARKRETCLFIAIACFAIAAALAICAWHPWPEMWR